MRVKAKPVRHFLPQRRRFCVKARAGSTPHTHVCVPVSVSDWWVKFTVKDTFQIYTVYE